MTRDQFREFVTTVINADPTWDGEYSVMERTVDTIVEQWESDVNDARIAGKNEFDPDFMESDTSSQPCMGPCCGGSI